MPTIVSIILSILTSGLPCVLLAVGIFITFRLLDFADMSAEASMLLGGTISLVLIKLGVNAFLTLPVSFVVGAACGFITSILHTKLKIPKLLSGIITLTMGASICAIFIGFTRAEPFGNLVSLGLNDKTIYSIFYIADAPLWNQPITALVMIVIVTIMIIVIYFFFGTEYGMAIRATGMNQKMARAEGINTDHAIIVGVSLSNALIGLAGALFAMQQRSMGLQSATGFLVIGLASIIIGEAIFGNRTFKINLISIATGAIIYFIIVTVAIELGLPPDLKNLLYAILITIALCLPLIKKGFKQLFAKLFKKKTGESEASV